MVRETHAFFKLIKVVIFMSRIDMSAPIPDNVLPDTSNIKIIPIDEPLVCISDKFRDIMVFESQYFKRGIPGAIRQIYVRKTVAEMLLKAAQALPAGYKLKIFDAWRPVAVQKALFDEYYASLVREFKDSGKSEAELKEMALLFVSYPSEDPGCPFAHATGGAVDLTIVDAAGRELNMGTDFDDFSDAANTVYFENTSLHEIRDNRRLLYNAMLSAGFTNFPSEWWHYDFGDRFWAATTNRESVYTGIYTEPLRS